MFSSRLSLAVPRFLWRGRWFWGAWLLLFLLPFTRHEARLHVLGSRFFSDLYEQPWQYRWLSEDDAPTPGLSPLERAVWLRVRSQEFDAYGSGRSGSANPASTAAGRLFHDFPREKWLYALALHQSLGWDLSLRGQSALGKWARAGEQLDAQNAFYPLILAKILEDSGRRKEGEAALQRAASCMRYDDGTAMLKKVALRATKGAGVSTWSELWSVWSRIDGNWYGGSNHLDNLLGQFVVVSQTEMTVARKAKSPALMRSALKRSNALMRVALLLQKAPCDANAWRVGADWARGAWRVARISRRFWGPPEPTAAQFIAFARAQKSEPNVRLAQKCAARVRLLAPSLRPETGLPSGAIFSTTQAMWAQTNGPIGFGVLSFGFYLLSWWWLVSLLGWRAIGHESKRSERVWPAAIVIVGTLLCFGLLTLLVMSWMQSPVTARRGPPIGKAEVSAALSIFSFFAPPLVLALWCGARAIRRHRAALALPARAQLEMNLGTLDAFVLARSTGAFVLSFVGLAIALSLLWGFLRWQGLVGYDWLRFLFPGVSPRLIDPQLTSLESPVVPSYCFLGIAVIALIWLISWRYGTDPTRRPIFHDGLRAWKESIGCALTLTVWVYMALLLVCHFTGETLSQRLDVVATRGEGAFVKGF